LPWTATLFVVAPVAGNLVNRVGERPLVVAGLLLQAVGMTWIGLIVTPTLAYVQLVAPLILAGAGVSMAMPAAQNTVLSSVTGSEIGKASGTFNICAISAACSALPYSSPYSLIDHPRRSA
jgi:MFS family permease